jgi:glycerol uptake facilitator-like aquaporin
MRLWFVNSWAYVCFVGLTVIVVALRNFTPKAALPEIAARVIGAACGLAIIVFGIWMNLR